jgi:hypothetical protein
MRSTGRPGLSSATPRRWSRSGSDPAAGGYIDVTGVVDVLANQDGDLWVFSIAGAVGRDK